MLKKVFLVLEIILKAFSRSQSASRNAQATLARVIAEALLDGKLAYTLDVIDYAEKAWTRNWLATAYLCFDHDWAMQQLFGGFKENSDNSLVSCMIGPLPRGELLSLKQNGSRAASPQPPQIWITY